MGEGVVDEVDAGLVEPELLGCRLAHHQRHGVVNDRGTAIDLLVGGHHLAIGELGPRDMRSDDLDHRSGAGRRGLQRLDHPGLAAFGDVNAQLAALEAVGAVLEDRQRRAFWQIADRLARRGRLGRQFGQA